MEIWFFTALAAAAFSASKYGVQKHLLEDYSSVEIGYLGSVLSFVFVLPVGAWAYLQHGLPLDPLAVAGVLISGVGNVVGFYMYLEALRIEDLSVVSPLRRVTPVLVAFVEPLVFGLTYSVNVVLGALMAAAGGYVVLSGRQLLRAVRPSRGALMALSVSVIYAFNVIAERYATQVIDPLLFSALVWAVILAGYAVLARHHGEISPASEFLRPAIILVGLLTVAGTVSMFYSLSIAEASRVATVKQAVIVFNVLIGGLYFGEENVLQKIIGSLMIISGIALVI
ncbi:MAG: DMT family transporter [Candidatus Nanohaloarchaea archaeon]